MIDPSTNSTSPLQQLQKTILQRQADLSGKHVTETLKISYTAQLLAGGVQQIGRKVIEEATEVVEAVGHPGKDGRKHTIHEAADLLYHLLVLLTSRNIRLEEVELELARRQGVSGLEEKAMRHSG